MTNDEPYENENVEAVFKAHEEQAARELRTSFFIDLERLTHMTVYDPAQWDYKTPGYGPEADEAELDDGHE